MKTYLLPAAALLLLALAAPASADPDGPGGSGCYGYYDYQEHYCYGLDSRSFDLACSLVESPCNLLHIHGADAHAPQGAQASQDCVKMQWCCYRVSGPIAIYNPLTGDKVTTLTDHTMRVGRCPHEPTPDGLPLH